MLLQATGALGGIGAEDITIILELGNFPIRSTSYNLNCGNGTEKNCNNDNLKKNGDFQLRRERLSKLHILINENKSGANKNFVQTLSKL